ncbi:hypothetical protein [Vibrio sp.]|uniref:hypothetical protein n=1 Tax=Vibrio sp. TaxID=678 RepID=UPI003D10F670
MISSRSQRQALLATLLFSLTGCSVSPGESQSSPDSSLPETTSGDTQNMAVQLDQWVDQQILAPYGLSMADKPVRYISGRADLNYDGTDELMVLIQDPYFCGSGGCSMYMFDHSGQVIHRMSVVRQPVLLADSFSNGWQDFIVWSNGSYRLMQYNGETYPANPSTAPKADLLAEEKQAKAMVAASEIYQEDGYDLMPYIDSELLGPSNIYQFSFKHYGDPGALYLAKVNMTSHELTITPVAMQQEPTTNASSQ